LIGPSDKEFYMMKIYLKNNKHAIKRITCGSEGILHTEDLIRLLLWFSDKGNDKVLDSKFGYAGYYSYIPIIIKR
jgi:hypothetical protein